MIVVLKREATEKQIEEMIEFLEKTGIQVHRFTGTSTTVLGLIGDTSTISSDDIEKKQIVESVKKVQTPYKRVSRSFHNTDSVIEASGIKIGGENFAVIAGPCAVENEDQIIKVAKCIKDAGGSMLRGGAFKPRTSPYSFQGLELEGLELLKLAKKETGLPIVTELMGTKHLDRFLEDVDIIQIGARNMQNFELLKELGKIKKPILLKRGLSSTIEEWLMSAEYILNGGNENVILCERGIRIYEKETRNTLDIQAVPVIHRLSHLPIIVDPSHAGGYRYLVPPMSKAAVMAGANGLMIEVHNDPENAASDGKQSLNLDEFIQTMKAIKVLVQMEGKNIQTLN